MLLLAQQGLINRLTCKLHVGYLTGYMYYVQLIRHKGHLQAPLDDTKHVITWVCNV